MKLDAFKNFVRNNPYLVKYVRENKMTWQKFYEIYDLYGEEDSIWNDFKDNSAFSTTNTSNIGNTFKEIVNLVKGIDLNSVQKALTSLDKAIEAFKGFNSNSNTSTYEEKPKNKFLED